jgi:hypothetical protein
MGGLYSVSVSKIKEVEELENYRVIAFGREIRNKNQKSENLYLFNS